MGNPAFNRDELNPYAPPQGYSRGAWLRGGEDPSGIQVSLVTHQWLFRRFVVTGRIDAEIVYD
jgi:hypothetical protein